MKVIEVNAGIFEQNDRAADEVRAINREAGTFMVNLMASPGAGKTTLLLRTIAALKDTFRIGVMEADIDATVDAEKGIVTFRLDSSLQGHLTGLRIDLPNTEQVVGIKDVTVSSAGVVKHRYHPCVFLAPENLKAQNGIRTISLVNARAKAYVGTTSEDPYLILSDPLTAQIAGMFSHYLLTRLLVCLFLIACFASYRKSLFGETQNNTSQSNTI